MRYILIITALLCVNACVSEHYGNEIHHFKAPSHQERQHNLATIKTQLALEYMQLGNYRQAMFSIDEAISAQENNIDAWLVRAHIQQSLKQYHDAAHSFQQALSLQPQHAEANNNYGWFLCKYQNLPEKALIYFDKALADPTYPTPHVALLNQALCLRQLHRYTDAELIFESLTQHYPSWAPIWKERAYNSFYAGQPSQAKLFIEHYQTLNQNLNQDELEFIQKLKAHHATQEYYND